MINHLFIPKFAVATIIWLILAGCTPIIYEPVALSTPPVQVTVSNLTQAASCSNTFVSHLLDHTTVASTQIVGLYESNGSGVAINDLDSDGDLDIVLANLGGMNSILWNQGNLVFETESLSHGASRAVNIVDVNGDGWQDIVFTRRFAKPTYWRNTGQTGPARFVEGELPAVNNPFYSMDWGDLDNDGDLDMVAGSYDTELRKQEGGIFDYRGGGVGVFVYTQTDNGFVAERLAEEADALTLNLVDLNNDGQLDILVGNDFDRPDYTWQHTETGWLAETPFANITANTMSFDVGDVDNNGSAEIFATDMKPYRQDEATMAAWMPLMDMMAHPAADDPQVVENVLQVRGADGRFENQANQRVLDATGWSWSSKFGDLNNDGFLDIYVVNGMIAEGMFDHLPNYELVEENQALHNDGQGYFVPAPEWGLGSTASGRGMSMADLDNDGDLDIVINNLSSPAQLFENQLCGGSSLEVELQWPEIKNPAAIGAKAILHTTEGTYYRTVRASNGYLSSDPTRLHFGLPTEATIEALEIHWPDGAVSHVKPLQPHTLVTVTRGQ